MRRAICMVILILWSSSLVGAQERQIPFLEYGDEMRAVLPLQSPESEFKFEGKQGDIVIIQASIRIDDILTAFFPYIALLNERGSTIATSREDTYEYTSILPIEIPADGEYTILVTPGDLSYLQSDSPFYLRVLRPPILEVNVPIAGKLDGENPDYFIVIANESFEIEVQRMDQSIYPGAAIANIQAGDFDVLGLMLGQKLVSGSLVIEPDRNAVHFVEVSKPTLEHAIIPIEAQISYQITLLK